MGSGEEAQALVAIGAIGGVVLAFWLTPAVARLALEQFGGVANREVRVGWQVIAVVAAAASACGWICALLPAISAAAIILSLRAAVQRIESLDH